MLRDLMNRTRGTPTSCATSSAADPSRPSNSAARRSEMGHAVSRADQVQVMTDAEGNVELTGRVLASELDTLLTTVRRVNGVNQITNRLIVLDREEPITGSASAGTAIPQM